MESPLDVAGGSFPIRISDRRHAHCTLHSGVNLLQPDIIKGARGRLMLGRIYNTNQLSNKQFPKKFLECVIHECKIQESQFVIKSNIFFVLMEDGGAILRKVRFTILMNSSCWSFHVYLLSTQSLLAWLAQFVPSPTNSPLLSHTHFCVAFPEFTSADTFRPVCLLREQPAMVQEQQTQKA